MSQITSLLTSQEQRTLFVWGICCVLAGVVFILYALSSLVGGRGEFVMPLDDVYIHFQYAKQIAVGQPYIYNPGLAPTSGATSFLYPYILAVGYVFGFHGLNLGLWAMGVGAVALAGAALLVYRLAKALDVPAWIALFMTVLFILNGPVSWHFMSGMETGLAVLFVLAALYSFVSQQLKGFIVSVALLALIRPEGGLFTAIAVVLFLLISPFPYKRKALLLLPMLAIGVQPLVNWWLTGSPVAAGNQAKSLLSLIPPDRDIIFGRIVENIIRIWHEIFLPTTGLIPMTTGVVGLGIAAVLGCVGLMLRKKRIFVVLAVLWLVSGTAAVATLDTAFWHFKRYQMPMIAVLFPFACVGIHSIIQGLYGLSQLNHKQAFLRLSELAVVSKILMLLLFAFMGLAAIAAAGTNFTFVRWYAANTASVYEQPLQMARWLAANTPEDARAAVHDVGMMRYIGSRTTLDMVGLTTPGAADYWRNGPGAVAEFLMRERPDYIAAYTDARGLSYLANTGIYDTLLAGFMVDYDEKSNVALGGHFQGIYKPDWTAAERKTEVHQPSILDYLTYMTIRERVELDVADLNSEMRSVYRWHNNENLPGFASEVYEQQYIDCFPAECLVLDGGRRINGEESFELFPAEAEDVLLVTRLHPAHSGILDIYVSGTNLPETFIGRRWIPAVPGQWLEIPVLIPRAYVVSPLRVRIVPHMPYGHYMPYYHWFFYGDYQPEVLVEDAPAATFQNGALVLAVFSIDYADKQLSVRLTWQTHTSAQGDYLVFVHLYDDLAQPPIAQMDQRPGNGTLPPGNWLPGVIRDTIIINMQDVPVGKYHLAVGLYDPLTNNRLQLDSGGDEFERLFIAEVEIK